MKEDDHTNKAPQSAAHAGALEQTIEPSTDWREHPLGNQQQPMIEAPDQIGPASSVPQPSQTHGDEQIAIGLQRSPAVAAQRDIEVISQPGREADMPMLPESRGRTDQVGLAKIA